MLTRRNFLIISASQAGCLLVPSVSAAQGVLHVHIGPECEAQTPIKEFRLGYPGFMHCKLHDHYQKAFKKWNCHCYTGQCRPTEFRVKKAPSDAFENYEIFINGLWFPIPRVAFRKEKAEMDEVLLQWDAHVCTSEPPNPHIECAWINLSS